MMALTINSGMYLVILSWPSAFHNYKHFHKDTKWVLVKSQNVTATCGVGGRHPVATWLNSYQTENAPISSILKLSQIQGQIQNSHGEHDIDS